MNYIHDADLDDKALSQDPGCRCRFYFGLVTIVAVICAIGYGPFALFR